MAYDSSQIIPVKKFSEKIPYTIPWAFLVFFLGIFGVVSPYISNGNLPGDIGDPRINLYLLEHFFLALTNQVESFTEASFFYPLAKTALLSDNYWGTGLIYSYFRSEKMTPTESFAGWFLLGFVVNYWSAFFVYRKLELTKIAAAIGAFLFTFSLPVISQEGHAQLLYRPYVPLAVLAFVYYFKSKNLRYGALTFLALSLQFLTCGYNGMFLLYLLSALFFVEFAAIPQNKIKNLLPTKFSLLTTLPIFCAACALLLLFAVPYFEVKNIYAFERHWSGIEPMLPRIHSYFVGDNSYLWFSKNAEVFSQIPSRNEHQMFIGVGAMLALLILFLRKDFLKHNQLALNFGHATAIIIAVTLFVGSASLYIFLSPLPGISSIRAVSRVILILLFPLGYLVGLSIDKIGAIKSEIFSSSTIIFIICALIIADPILAKKIITSEGEWQKRSEVLASKISQKIDKSNILVVASNSDCSIENFDAMMLSQELGIKTINGCASFYPGEFHALNSCLEVEKRVVFGEKFMSKLTGKDFQIDRSKLVYVGFKENCR
jgi:hypothetical protein